MTTTGAPRPTRTGWGGSPVSVGSHLQRIRAVQEHVPRFEPPQVLAPTSPVGDLFGFRGKAQKAAVADLLRRGLEGLPGKTALVGSLFGGAGVSTLAALVWSTWSGRGIDGVLVDTTTQFVPGLPNRVSPAGLAGAPTWADFETTCRARVGADFTTVRARREGRSVLVQSAGPSAAIPDPSLVGSVVSVAASAWPMVVVDGGALGQARFEGLLTTIVPNLLVLVCRSDVDEIRSTTGYLRQVHQRGVVDCQQRAVIAAVGCRHSARTAQALAAAADVVAGAIPLRFDRRLVDRGVQVSASHTSSTTELLAAAMAQAPRNTTKEQHNE